MASKKPNKAARVKRLKDKDAIKLVRKFVPGFDASDGVSLSKLDKVPAAKLRSARAKAQKIQRMLATPHVEVKPADDKQAKVLRRETNQRFKGQRKFIVHVPDPTHSAVTVDDEKLTITTHMPGRVEFDETFFRFRRRPRTPEDMLKLLEEMLPDMPDEGEYQMVTDTYGPTGEIAEKDALIDQLQARLNAYDDKKYGSNRFLNRVLGWRWTRTKAAGQVVRQRRRAARDKARADYKRRQKKYREDAG